MINFTQFKAKHTTQRQWNKILKKIMILVWRMQMLKSCRKMLTELESHMNATNATMLFQGRKFEDTFENGHWRKINATNATMHLIRQAIWGDIWKIIVSESKTNATNVIMHPPMQALWGHIWKRTVEKSQTNATNATMPLLRQTIWDNIWKRTVEKSQRNATNVIMLLLGQAF